jgi:hypothetical protein
MLVRTELSHVHILRRLSDLERELNALKVYCLGFMPSTIKSVIVVALIARPVALIMELHRCAWQLSQANERHDWRAIS